ncbi:MAG: nucleotidyltransferase family protein [Planctomycetes bacterium]|nr:nucleotidyltransferase family protein [Planctomycetota bacterium]
MNTPMGDQAASSTLDEAHRTGAARRAAVILAAGRGSRMGCPKSIMQVRGRPWWQRQVAALDEAGVAGLWVVQEQTLLAMRHAGFNGVTVAGEDGPMFQSVHRGAAYAVEALPWCEYVFILPVDVPVPRADVWTILATAADPVSVPTFLGVHGHPVCLTRRFAEEVVVSGEPQVGRLDQLISKHVRYVEVGDADVVANLNTPDAVAAWEAGGHTGRTT